MNAFQKKTAMLIAMVSVLLAAIASPLAWQVARFQTEQSIVSLALEESQRLLSYYDAKNLTEPEAVNRAVMAAQSLAGGLFDIVEIYDHQGRLLAESHTDKGSALEKMIHEHAKPRYSTTTHEILKIADGKWAMRVLVPLFVASQPGKITGYFEGVRVVPSWQQEQILSSSLVVALMVSFASLLCGLSIYPVVVHLSKENAHKAREVLESHIAMMDALGRAIAKRDSETGTHNYRVAWIASRIAESMGLEGRDMQSLIAGSFLHDVGKIGISDLILLKPGKLSEEEFELMQKHVMLGEEIVSDIPWLRGAKDVVAAHHEKWDGSGYPRGLSGETIPLAARIFAVADVFDALCSKRPYKEAMGFADVMDILEQETGSHFDPRVVEMFRDIAHDIFTRLNRSNESQVRELLGSRVKQYFEM